MFVKLNACMPFTYRVGDVIPGRPVIFDKKFHQDNRDDDVFMVLDVCGTYFPQCTRHRNDTIGVANVRTGKLSYVDGDRPVTVMDATVNVTRKRR